MKDISPLKITTIETLYPELQFNYPNGHNNKDNSVYLEINGNKIIIHAKVKFFKNYNEPVPSSISVTNSSTKTMKELFIEGVKEYWTGTKDGNLYDFYPDMKVTTSVDIEEATGDTSYINVNLTDGCAIATYVISKGDKLFYIAAGGDWTTSNAKTMHINACTKHDKLNPFKAKDCSEYDEACKKVVNSGSTITTLDERYKYLCAHEFGHILGIWDAYGNKKSANNGYCISEDFSSVNLIHEFTNNEIMRDRYLEADSNRNASISANDIEMMLQAFSENDWQYFYEDKCNFWDRRVDQKLSKAIKHPEPTYEFYNDVNGNYDYFVWDRDTKTKKQIGSGDTFTNNWLR